MALINRVPAGLLSLLGIKAGGVNPAVLTDDVRPILDLTDLYTVGAIERLVASVNVAAVGSAVPTGTTVPDNELWLVRDFSIYSPTAGLGAGQALQFTPTYVYSLGGSTRHSAVGAPSNIGAVGDVVMATSHAPFIATSGTTLAGMVNRLAAGPVNGVLFTASICRLTV